MDTTRSLPSGTVTFLFTDIEGSTRLWEQDPEVMRDALTRHDALLRRAIEVHGGHVFKTVGDEFCAAFRTAPDALAAAIDAQRALLDGGVGPAAGLSIGDAGQAASRPHPRVRMALHTSAADERGGDYFGASLSRIARLLDAGHGGQVLLSQ